MMCAITLFHLAHRMLQHQSFTGDCRQLEVIHNYRVTHDLILVLLIKQEYFLRSYQLSLKINYVTCLQIINFKFVNAPKLLNSNF